MILSSDAGLPVLLTTVFDPVEAEIIVAKLRGAGIEAVVRHEALSVVYGLTVDGCGQQDILVRPSDLEVAREVLESPVEEPGAGQP
jgi:Putative prokaryotic signal transducing protein